MKNINKQQQHSFEHMYQLLYEDQSHLAYLHAHI
jgi:hypothetical protein